MVEQVVARAVRLCDTDRLLSAVMAVGRKRECGLMRMEEEGQALRRLRVAIYGD